jgi:TP901 family phage tail tape measure protein
MQNQSRVLNWFDLKQSQAAQVAMANATKQYAQMAASIKNSNNQISYSSDAVNKGQIGIDNFATAAANATKKVLLWQVAIGAVYGVLHGITNAVETWKQIDLAVSRIAITTNQAGAGLQSYLQKVADISVAFGIPLDKALQGMDLALKVTASMADETEKLATATTLLKDSSMLANITGMQLTQSMDILVASLRQTGLGLSDGAKLLDKWVAVSKTADINVTSLAQGFAIMADAAETAGLDVDQINGLIAALSESVTLGPAELGNSVRALMSTMYSPTAVKVLQQYGVAVKSNTGELRNFWDIMQQLSAMKMTGILDDSAWLEISKAVGGGQRRYAQFLVLLQNFQTAAEVANVSANETLYGSGAAASANDKIVNTLAMSYERLSAATTEMYTNFGFKSGALNDLNDVVSTFASWVDWTAKLNSGLMTVAKTLGYVGAAVVASMGASASVRWIKSNEAYLGIAAKIAGQQPSVVYGTQASEVAKSSLAQETKIRLGELAVTTGKGTSLFGPAQKAMYDKGSEKILSDTAEALKGVGVVTPDEIRSARNYVLTGLIPNWGVKLPFNAPIIGNNIGYLGDKERLKQEQAVIKGTGQKVLGPFLTDLNNYVDRELKNGQWRWKSGVIYGKTSGMYPPNPFNYKQGQSIGGQFAPSPNALPFTTAPPGQPHTGLQLLDWKTVIKETIAVLTKRTGVIESITRGATSGIAAYGITGNSATAYGAAVGGALGSWMAGPLGQAAGTVLGGFVGASIGDSLKTNAERIKAYWKDTADIFGLNLDKILSQSVIKTKEDLYQALKSAGEVAPMFPGTAYAQATPTAERLGATVDLTTKYLPENIRKGYAGFYNNISWMPDVMKQFATGQAGINNGVGMQPWARGGENEWKEGLGALPLMVKGLKEGSISADQFKKSIAGIDIGPLIDELVKTGDIDKFNKSLADSGKTAFVSWNTMDKQLVALIELFGKAVQSSGMFATSAKLVSEEVAAKLAVARKNAETDQTDINEQKIAKEMINSKSEALGNMTLKEYFATQQEKLFADQINMSDEDFTKHLSTIVGGDYAYADYIAKIYMLKDEYKGATGEVAKFVDKISTVKLDQFQNVRLNNPELYAKALSSIETLESNRQTIEKFYDSRPIDIAATIGIKKEDLDMGNLEDIMSKLTTLRGQTNDTVAIDKLLTDIQNIINLQKAMPGLAIQASTYSSKLTKYNNVGDIRMEASQEYKNFIGNISKLKEFEDLARSMRDQTEKTITLIDVMTGEQTKIQSTTDALDFYGKWLQENANTNRGSYDYNLPAGYEAPSRYWALKTTGTAEFGPASGKYWTMWQEFIQKNALSNNALKDLSTATNSTNDYEKLSYEMWKEYIDAQNKLNAPKGGVTPQNNPTTPSSLTQEQRDLLSGRTYVTPTVTETKDNPLLDLFKDTGVRRGLPPYQGPDRSADEKAVKDFFGQFFTGGRQSPMSGYKVPDRSEDAKAVEDFLTKIGGWMLNPIGSIIDAFTMKVSAATNSIDAPNSIFNGAPPLTSDEFGANGPTVDFTPTNSILDNSYQTMLVSQGYLAQINMGINSLRQDIQDLKNVMASNGNTNTSSFDTTARAGYAGITSLGVSRK